MTEISEFYMTMIGDWGGQIYLTVPIRLMGINIRIFELLEVLDEFAWECNEGDGADFYFEERLPSKTCDYLLVDIAFHTDFNDSTDLGKCFHCEKGYHFRSDVRKLDFTGKITSMLDLHNPRKITVDEFRDYE